MISTRNALSIMNFLKMHKYTAFYEAAHFSDNPLNKDLVELQFTIIVHNSLLLMNVKYCYKCHSMMFSKLFNLKSMRLKINI